MADLGNKHARRRGPLSAGQRRARRSRAAKALAVALLLALCALLAAFVGTSDYTASLFGWLPLLLVALTVAAAWAYLRLARRGFSVAEVPGVSDCMRGQDVRFSVRFRNGSPLFLMRVEAYFFISDLFGNRASESMTTLSLKPRESYDMAFTARFDHIGTYTAGVDRVVLCDFLRLFTYEVRVDGHRPVQVTPHIQPVREIEFTNAALVENKRALRATLADSLDYAYVRDYVPGDPIKNIHWKISARAQGYMTRLYEVYTNPGVAVLMDFFAPSEKAESLMGMFDCIVESAFSVARYAQRQGMEVEVHYVDKLGKRRARMQWDMRDLPEIVEEMPRVSNDAKSQAEGLRLLREQTMAQYGQNNVVVCTADLSSEMVSAVIEAKMRRRDPILFAVVPNELVGREREDWCANLARLDAAGIGYVALSRSDELAGGDA